MTKVYTFDFSASEKELSFLSYIKQLTLKEQKTAKKKKNMLIRKQYVFSRLLLKYALSECGYEYGEIIKNEKGKPYFKKDMQSSNNMPFFSISHSGNCVTVAISDKEVGVDVQKEAVISKRVIDKFFSEEEKAYIENGIIMPCVLWCVKESVFKYDGTGIMPAVGVNKIVVKNENIFIDRRESLFIKGALKNGYYICVCSEDENTEFIFL